MIELPTTAWVPVVRTDFTNDLLWEQIRNEITTPSADGFLANVEFVDNPALSGLDATAIAESVPRQYPSGYKHPVMFIVDTITVRSIDHRVLVVSLDQDGPPSTFRVIPQELWAVENNLSLAKMDYSDFAQSTDDEGVFRGF